jgi:hypothetical protein
MFRSIISHTLPCLKFDLYDLPFCNTHSHTSAGRQLEILCVLQLHNFQWDTHTHYLPTVSMSYVLMLRNFHSFITRTILGEQYKSFSSSLCNLLHSSVSSSLLRPNILLNTMFSNTLSFFSSRNVNDQVSHPYKTTGKIIVLFLL